MCVCVCVRIVGGVVYDRQEELWEEEVEVLCNIHSFIGLL